MFINVNGINLFYQKTGYGQPLILLHGNGESHHIFDKAVDVLKNHFTVYAIDTRGHGESSSAQEYHYDEMADDIYRFISWLEIKNPALYGFSDGGILGLLVAFHHPGLLSNLIISGANTDPKGIKKGWLFLFKTIYTITRSPKFKLMLTEPNITDDMLKTISVPTYVTAGERDLICTEHTQYIHSNIPESKLKIFPGETHGSYIINSKKIAYLLIDILTKQTE